PVVPPLPTASRAHVSIQQGFHPTCVDGFQSPPVQKLGVKRGGTQPCGCGRASAGTERGRPPILRTLGGRPPGHSAMESAEQMRWLRLASLCGPKTFSDPYCPLL